MEIQDIFAAMNTSFDQLLASRAHGENSYNQNGRSSGLGGPSHTVAPKLPKLDFLRFNGSEDPTNWIRRAGQLFEFQGTPTKEQVPLVAYHLEGEARLWYQLHKEEEGPVSWNVLKECLHARYGPTQFEEFFGDLTKLKQNGTIGEYQCQFERLLSRARKLMPPQQVSCFVSGPKDNICTVVQATRPATLSAPQWIRG